jgi:OPT family oligopeptide transporter
LPPRGTAPKTGAGFRAADWNILLENKLVMIAAGALTGPRICLSMVASGLLLCYWLGPSGLTAGAVHNPAHAWREIGVWVGAPMMIAAGLLSFALQGRTLGRALRGLITRGGSQDHAAVEVPTSWFGAGTLVATGGVLAIGHLYFGIPWHLGLLAVAMTFFLSLVACRATGESDITPIGALGKITQLVYGVLIPQNATANLMTAGITANAAASSADLLTDLKSGYLLGAHPRRQFVAQFLGIFAGTVATILGFRLLVPDATVLTGTPGSPAAFAAPSAQAWLAVARVFQGGLQNLHPMARTCIWWGLGAGALLVVVELALPRCRKWLPSPTGLGLGFILPFFNPFSMLLGALVAWLWSRHNSAHADRYVVPVASGIIAGESIVSVAIALVKTLLLRH